MGRFLDNVHLFDATLFKISSAEAEGLDPQTRLLLEGNLEVLMNIDWHEGQKNPFGMYVPF